MMKIKRRAKRWAACYKIGTWSKDHGRVWAFFYMIRVAYKLDKKLPL